MKDSEQSRSLTGRSTRVHPLLEGAPKQHLPEGNITNACKNKRAQKQALSIKDRHRQNMWNRIKAPGITHYWEEPRKRLFPNGTSRKQTKPNGRRNQKHIQIMTVTRTKHIKRIRTALFIDCSSHRGSPITRRSLGTASFWTEHHINKQDRMTGKTKR